MIVLQFRIRKVIPAAHGPSARGQIIEEAKNVRARVAIQQRRRLDNLFPVLATLTLERFVRLA